MVTARRLLHHEGGLRPSVFEDVFNRQHYPSVEDALERFAEDSLVAEPGTRAVYSNAGYTLLACAVEGASGVPFHTYLQDRVIKPANMNHTRVDNSYEVAAGRAGAYMIRTEANTSAWIGLWQQKHLRSTQVGVPFNADPVDPSWAPGAGGYLTTPLDLVCLREPLWTGRCFPASWFRKCSNDTR